MNNIPHTVLVTTQGRARIEFVCSVAYVNGGWSVEAEVIRLAEDSEDYEPWVFHRSFLREEHAERLVARIEEEGSIDLTHWIVRTAIESQEAWDTGLFGDM